MNGKVKGRGPTSSVRECCELLNVHPRPRDEKCELCPAPEVPCSTQEWLDLTSAHRTPPCLSTMVQSAKGSISLPRHPKALEPKVLFGT